MPNRMAKPLDDSDEGGLWAIMDREEARLRRSPFLMRETGLREYLQEIACRLAADHCPDVRVYPVRTPHFNASMAPNGMMQIWSGLLLRVDNEAQLAAVLGHELGHYLQRHSIEQLRDARVRSAFSTLLAAFGGIGAVGQIVTLASELAYSRDHEREADRIGIELMRTAGYDPREAWKVWDNLLSELKAGKRGDPWKISALFASHPPSAERRDVLRQMAGDGGGELGDDRWRERTASLRFPLLEDELRRGQFEETLALVDRKIASQPDRSDLYYFRAETYRMRAQEGDQERAFKALQHGIALGGEPAQSHRALGFIYRERKEFEPARAALARYLELSPSAPDAGIVQTYLSELK